MPALLFLVAQLYHGLEEANRIVEEGEAQIGASLDQMIANLDENNAKLDQQLADLRGMRRVRGAE
jgi:hypothetical protein